MAYLDTQNLNEDFKTAVHNWITGGIGGYHAKNIKNGINLGLGILYASPLSIGSSLLGGKDWIDQKYFNHHWHLPDSIKSEIAKWCKAAGATPFKKKELKFGLNSTNLRQDGHELGKQKTNLATRGFGKGALTTATTCIPIAAGNNMYYYVYPTFDASKIFDMKALKQTGTGKDDYKVVELTQWKKIDQEKYNIYWKEE